MGGSAGSINETTRSVVGSLEFGVLVILWWVGFVTVLFNGAHCILNGALVRELFLNGAHCILNGAGVCCLH